MNVFARNRYFVTSLKNLLLITSANKRELESRLPPIKLDEPQSNFPHADNFLRKGGAKFSVWFNREHGQLSAYERCLPLFL